MLPPLATKTCTMLHFLTIVLLVSCTISESASTTSQNGISEFCDKWYPQQKDACEYSVDGNVDFESNVAYVSSRREADPSLCIGYYTNYTLDSFKENMLMQTESFPLRMSGPSASPSCDVPSVSRSYDYLNSLSLSPNSHFVSYAISGALDLMWAQFKEHDPSFNVEFSTDMVIDALGENASASEVLDFLKHSGVCSKEAYEADADHSNPTCCTYRLSSYRQLRGLSSCDLARKLTVEPLYVELALNPLHYMLSLCEESHPIRQATNRYTVAGVLTGFNNAEQYWNVMIRRHVGGHNHVKVQALWETGFAAITGHVYAVEVDTSSGTTNAQGNSCAAPVEPSTPHSPYCGSEYNQCWVDHPNDADGKCRECVASNTFSFATCLSTPGVTHVVVEYGANLGPMQRISLEGKKGNTVQHMCFEEDVGKSITLLNLICDGSSPLESLFFGEFSFTANYMTQEPAKSANIDRGLHITKCTSLKSMEMKKGAFGDYSVIRMDTVPLLNTWKVGTINADDSVCNNFCFVTSPNYVWKGTNSLQTVVVGNGAFVQLTKDKFTAPFANKNIQVGPHAFKN